MKNHGRTDDTAMGERAAELAEEAA